MLQKQTATINFSAGLDLKTDKNQIPFGKFVSLQNSIFDTLGQLTKRNGFGSLSTTTGSVTFLTTFQENLIGIGASLQSYSGALGSFVDKGQVPRVDLSVMPLSNNLYGALQCDSAIGNGLICLTSAVTPPTAPAIVIPGAPNVMWQYSIIEQATGQILSGPTQLVSSGGYQMYSPRTFAVGSSFIILYDAHQPVVGSTSHLEYVSVSMTSPFTTSSVTVISSNCFFSSSLAFDAVVASNSTLSVVWNVSSCSIANETPSSGTNLRTLGPPNSPNLTFTQSAIRRVQPAPAAIISVCADNTQSPPVVWSTMSSLSINQGTILYVASNSLGSATFTANSVVCTSNVAVASTIINRVINHTPFAQNGTMTCFLEVLNNYQYIGSLSKPSNLIAKFEANLVGGSTTMVQVARGLGLGSKAFISGSQGYVLGAYSSQYQNSYFLINSTGSVQAKVAYGNGGGYLITGLPNANVVGSSCFIPYLIKTTISPVGKLSNVSSQTGIFSALGLNMAKFNFSGEQTETKEIGQNLILNGGFLGGYDGQQFTENNFFLYPENVQINDLGGGNLAAATTYFYSATYEWTDNKGNSFRSAPSIPIGYVTGSANTLQVSIPTLRLSYKNWPYGGSSASPVRIGLYRWSSAQQVYYFVSYSTQDTASTNADSISIIDNFSDNNILGNQILYTNGGIVEDVNGPACTAMTTFDSRLWIINAEDQNLLGYSKQVIENTPVEMSDLFTFYVAPNIGAEGPTGTMKCLAPMDDKLIIFKAGAIYYINGVGPDNTGASSQYSEPIFITSTVGCSNPKSIVLIPQGLMFQSDKGIWVLGRDLSTQYIGKDVESLVLSSRVLSAITIPKTNQVRFTLNSGTTLLYDYLVGQWGTFSGVPGVSSVVYKGLHTYVNSSSSIFQETPGLYLDGSIPTTMSFTTGFASLGGLEGYVRAYKAYLLGSYYSPHTFTLSVAYDYNPAILQTAVVNPTNTAGSGSQVEQWRINFAQQQCQSFQLTLTETSSQSAGQGVSFSGLKLVYGSDGKGSPRNIGAGNITS